jgi:hypothetical protein
MHTLLMLQPLAFRQLRHLGRLGSWLVALVQWPRSSTMHTATTEQADMLNCAVPTHGIKVSQYYCKLSSN